MSVTKVCRYVHFKGLVDNSVEIRRATFEGNDHIVVPVVALVGDVVVTPFNSTSPELIPASELANTPGGWDNRPVLADHPKDDEQTPVSANDPTLLEALSFGRLFHTKFEGNKLKTEAWLDPTKAEQVGDDAVGVIKRCEAGEMVEVSVGAWMTAEQSPGTIDGNDYDSVWRDIVPDHLAMGLSGLKGACSVEMGCGAPRVNSELD